MTGRQEDHLEPGGRLGAAAVHLGREMSLGAPEVEPGEGVERLAQERRIGGHEDGQLVEDPVDLGLLGDLRLPPGVAELHGHERLHEQGLAAPRRVVDDALDLAPRLGLDRHDVAPVAERDDRLLEGAAELGADERVEPPPKPVVGDPDRRAQAAEPRRGGVEQLADRVEAPGQRAPQRGQAVEFVAQVPEQGPPLIREGRGEAGGRVDRVADLQELCRLQPAPAHRPLHGRADVVRRADAHPRSFREERPRLVGLVQRSGDDHRVGRRLQRFGEPTARPE